MRYILGTLVAPLRTLREVAEERPLIPAGWVFCLGVLSAIFGFRWACYWAGASAVDRVAEICPALNVPAFLVFGTHPLYLLLAGPPAFLAGWFIRAAFLHLAAELLGGTGRGLSVLATLGFAWTPLLFVAPLAVALAAAGGWSLEAGWPAVVWRWGVMLLVVWLVALIVVAVQQSHGLSTQRAALALLALLVGLVLLYALGWVGFAVSGMQVGGLTAVS